MPGPRRASWIVGMAIAILIVGWTATGILHLKAVANEMVCQSALRNIVIACHWYHRDNNKFPLATIDPAKCPLLRPEQRLPWTIEILPYLEPRVLKVDVTQAWDAEPNQRAGSGFLPWQLICPAQAQRFDREHSGVNPFMALSGIGANAPRLPIANADAGIWGYERQFTIEAILTRRGLSNTLMLSETSRDLGSWCGGGSATLRALIPKQGPYLGYGGQFEGPHPCGGGSAAFCDGSVRRFDHRRISPKVFEALVRVNGKEPIEWSAVE